MDAVYSIVINITTWQGIQEIGSFLLGTNVDFAHGVFDRLKGDLTSKEDALIRIDMEKREEGVLPVRLKSICCSLTQYVENCKVITVDIFKYFTFENER